jgi:hypothetical protein
VLAANNQLRPSRGFPKSVGESRISQQKPKLAIARQILVQCLAGHLKIALLRNTPTVVQKGGEIEVAD